MLGMDALSIVVNSKWETEQMGYHYTRLTNDGLIYEMKQKDGWPADINKYDDNFIYLWVTEADAPNRENPRCYKKNIGPTGKGWPVIPRRITQLPSVLNYRRRVSRRPGVFAPTDTVYEFYENCNRVRTASLGEIRAIFDGPFVMDWAGDVKVAPTYILTYLYNGRLGVFHARERFYYALRPEGGSFGWITWDVAGMDTVSGLFKVSNQSVRVDIQRVPPPPIVNPCALV